MSHYRNRDLRQEEGRSHVAPRIALGYAWLSMPKGRGVGNEEN